MSVCRPVFTSIVKKVVEDAYEPEVCTVSQFCLHQNSTRIGQELSDI